MAGGFHPLRVTEVQPLTEDAVAVTFAVPPELRPAYRYTAGQHLILRRVTSDQDGTPQEIRRTYSICAPAPGPDGPATLRVGIRRVQGGEFSTFAHKELAPGDLLDVMTPTGRFTLVPRPGRYAAVVGGSGITPVLSLVSTLLAEEPDAEFCLVRSDRTVASAMFLDEVAELKDRHPRRLHLVQVLTREERQAGLEAGRLDEDRLTALLPALLPVGEVAGWFLCGPHRLIEQSAGALRRLGVDRSRVHQEIFHVDSEPPPGDGASAGRGTAGAFGADDDAGAGGHTVTAVLGGRSGSWVGQPGETALETVLRHRPDAPYACRGGVCGTCRALLVSGTVRMDRNYALEPDELDAGHVLACQSHPTSPVVELDFDR